MAVFRALMYVHRCAYVLYNKIHTYTFTRVQFSYPFFFFSIIVYINLLRIPPTQSKKKPPRAFTRKKNNKKIKNEK